MEPIPLNSHGNLGASGWIRTNDLELMGLTSYRTALRRRKTPVYCQTGKCTVILILIMFVVFVPTTGGASSDPIDDNGFCVTH